MRPERRLYLQTLHKYSRLLELSFRGVIKPLCYIPARLTCFPYWLPHCCCCLFLRWVFYGALSSSNVLEHRAANMKQQLLQALTYFEESWSPHRLSEVRNPGQSNTVRHSPLHFTNISRSCSLWESNPTCTVTNGTFKSSNNGIYSSVALVSLYNWRYVQ